MEAIYRYIIPLLITFAGYYVQETSPASEESIALARAGCLLVLIGILIESKYVLRIVGDDVYTGAGNLIVGKVPPVEDVSEILCVRSV
jgi:hypothetical protein